jgi:hypothetical protein
MFSQTGAAVTPPGRHQINAIDPDTAIAATGKMTGLIIAHHALWYALLTAA